MYKVKMDGKVLYYPGDKEAALINPVLKLQTGYAGSFEFTIPPVNPLYDEIQNRSSMVSVFKDRKEIFFGEVRKMPKKDRYKNKNVYCAGAMSFLADSVQPQAEYHNLTPRQMLETWLNEHNSQVEARKRIYIGIVTIHDANDSLYRYTNRENTLKAIREKLVEKLGGYLRLRHENGKLYLDWVTIEEYGKYCEQFIEFGSNLLEYSESISAENLVTALIPLGARLEGESEIEALEKYVDITSVNAGKDYIYNQEAVNMFGWIWTTNTWQDVTEPSNLLKKAKVWLKDNQFEEWTLSLTAVDLSELNQEYDAFECGDRIRCRARPYGMDRIFPVQEMTIYIQMPDKNRLTLGDTMVKTYSASAREKSREISTQLENVRKTTSWMKSAIDNATAMMTGSRGGYKVTEYDEDGRWLRDLYMNAPNKEDATLVMQINMNGIGFSREGFNGPYKNAWTIDGVLLGEFIKAGSITAEKLSVEYRQSVTDEIVSKFNVAAGKIEAEVTRAKGVEVELAAALRITEELIETKVSKNGFGTYVQQYWDKIIYGFNYSSKYVQINPGEIAIYNNGVSESKKRSMFDEDGNHFYRDGYYLGKIGTNYWVKRPAHKGLVFDLEYEGKYMSFSRMEKSDSDSYTVMWTYSRENSIFDYEGLWAGVDIFLNGCTLYTGADKNNGVRGASAGLWLNTNNTMYFRVNETTKCRIENEGVKIPGGSGLTAYNNTSLNFYSDLDMHNFNVLNNSDERLKKNFDEPQHSALERLLKVDVLQYDWRIADEHVDMGFVAQQLQSVIPEAVSISEDTELYSIKTNRLIPYLVRSIQELYELVNSETVVNSLDNTGNVNEDRNGELTSNKVKTTRKMRYKVGYTDEQIQAAVEAFIGQAESKRDDPVRLEPKIVTFKAQR